MAVVVDEDEDVAVVVEAVATVALVVVAEKAREGVTKATSSASSERSTGTMQIDARVRGRMKKPIMSRRLSSRLRY